MKTFMFSIIISATAVFGSDRYSTQSPQAKEGGIFYASIEMPGELEPDRALIVDPSGALSSREKQRESLGIVTITGVVPSQSCKEKIADAVRSQTGVREVKNELVVLETVRDVRSPDRSRDKK